MWGWYWITVSNLTYLLFVQLYLFCVTNVKNVNFFGIINSFFFWVESYLFRHLCAGRSVNIWRINCIVTYDQHLIVSGLYGNNYSESYYSWYYIDKISVQRVYRNLILHNCSNYKTRTLKSRKIIFCNHSIMSYIKNVNSYIKTFLI